MRSGLAITASDLERDDPWLLRSAIRDDGGLAECAAAAGIALVPRRKRRWTKEELARALRKRLRERLPMNAGAIRNDDPRLDAVLKSRYGELSHPRVARSLGLPPCRALASVKTRWSRARVVA